LAFASAWSPSHGVHFYTASAAERDMIRKTMPGWTYEGAVYTAYADKPAGGVAVYRFYNTLTGAHFYTASAGERDYVKKTDKNYHYEGQAYYILK
jgi:hypothetical protein